MTDIIEVASGELEIVEVSSGSIEIIEIAVQGPPGADGATDHGALTGLSDDDHLAYHTDARGDARYSPLAHDHSGVYEPADADIQSHLASTSNPHSVTAAQVGADATGTAAGLIATHEAAVNPHPGYLTPTEGDAAYAALSHDHSGVYDAAGTASSTVSSHEGAADPHPGYALESSLGGAALLSVGTTTGTVAAGDDARFATGTTGDAFASSHPGGNSHIDWTADQGATNLHAGNIPDLSGTYAAASHNHAASAITSGTLDTARLGSGTANSSTYLRGDQTWAAAAGGVASDTHATTEKTTPVDADELPLVDSAASFVLKRLTWANVKTALANFFMIKKQTNAVGIGFQALLNNTGQNNYAIGSYALTANTSAMYNTAIGSYALRTVTTTGQNTAIGSLALSEYTADGNTAIGYKSQEKNISGLACVSIGSGALGAGACGNGNVAIGNNALNATTGTDNLGIGWTALLNNTTGSGNIAIGRNAGRFQANGSTALTDPENSVYIGCVARGKDNADNNSVVIGGNTPIGLGANTTVIGTSSTTLTRLFGNLGLGVDSPSASIHTIKTTEQLRLGYDASYYAAFTVSSAGNLTIDAVGGTIYTPDTIENTVNGGGIVLRSPDGTRYLITVANGGTLSVSAA